MDEVYSAPYVFADAQWLLQTELAVGPPQDVMAIDGFTVAGNAQAPYGERLLPALPHVHAMPTASALLNLAPALLAQGRAVAAQDALPLYIRDKVAKTTAEREALKANEQAEPEQATPRA